MSDHYCPVCGAQHADPGDEPAAATEGATDEAAAVATVAVAAIEALVDVVAEHEETDRLAEQTEMVETLAEEASEVATAEAVADASEDDDPGEDEDPEYDQAEEEPGAEVEEEEAENGAGHEGEATPVTVPPQLHEEDEGPRSSTTSAPAFRRRRVRR